MQSESSAVSQKTSFQDTPLINTSPIQHGNDPEAGPVSGLLQQGKSGDSAAPGSSTPGEPFAPLSEAASTPPSAQRVIQYENAGSPGKKSTTSEFQVVADSHSSLPLETLPNGRSIEGKSTTVSIEMLTTT